LKDERKSTWKRRRIIAVAVLIVGSGRPLHVARAQQPELERTDIQRHDLSVPGREVIQARVELERVLRPPGTRIRGEETLLRRRWSTSTVTEMMADQTIIVPRRNDI
jgi:hypothetical protein